MKDTEPSELRRLESIGPAVEEGRRRAPGTCFSELAREILLSSGAHRSYQPWRAVRELQRCDWLPEQMDPEATFSDLPLTLHRSAEFHVDLLHWLDGTTSIHQHAFSGAFQVLSGSSIHVTYAFEREHVVNERLILGRLSPQRIELLEAGDVVEIRSGVEGIHALFHLDSPSVTLVVRTRHDTGAGPQYDYLRPSVAYDPFARPPSIARRVQSQTLLYRARHPDYDQIVADSLAHSDLETAFHVLRAAYTHLSDDEVPNGLERFGRLDALARARHGERAEPLRPAFEEEERRFNLTGRRRLVREPRHRFFLAVLLNAPGRLAALELVRRRHPDRDPAELMAGWLGELCEAPSPGEPAGHAETASILGVHGVDADVLSIFQALLDGLSAAEIGSRLPGVDGVEIEETCASLRTSPLFCSILE